jgi:predicted nuclease with RNAse H fold
MSSSIVVAGVDVGGTAKGFHGVALRGGRYLDRFASCNVAEVADWCRQINARIVGIDAPCRWSATGRARTAERQLMAKGIWCFSTPSRQAAQNHHKDHFRWMLNGADLYANLETTHTLFDSNFDPRSRPMCFETFPQAIACVLAGKIVSAKQKHRIRRDLLNTAKIDISKLTKIDEVDAALCAFTAHQLAKGNRKCYGEALGGFIIVPGRSLRV